jgi:hypothetical protein
MSEIDRALLAGVIGGASAGQKRLQSLVTEIRSLNTKIVNPQGGGSDTPQPSALMSQIPQKPSGTSLAHIPAQLGTIGAPRGGS